MCPRTLAPHCGHWESFGACQRFAALRVRKRIFEVLRFGTPHKIRLLFLSFFGLQTIQNAPWRVARRLGGIAGRL